MYRSASWGTADGHVVRYDWGADGGARAMAEAMDFIDRATAHECGRITGMVAPSQIDTCTPELIRDSHAEAQRRGVPMQIHAAQSVVEFH